MRLFWICCFILMMSGVATASKTSSIAVLSYKNKQDTLRLWQPLADYLSDTVAGYQFVIQPMTHKEIEDSIRRHTVDFVFTNPSHYVVLKNLNHMTYAMATLVKKYQDIPLYSFGGVIFVRSDSGIYDLEDIKYKRLAAVKIDGALGGFQIQAHELKKNRIDVFNDVEINVTGLPQSKVISTVMEGKADVGFVRTGVLEFLAQKGTIDLKEIRILNQKSSSGFPYQCSTDLYPEWPFIATYYTDEDLLMQVNMALFQMKYHPEVTESLNIKRFRIPDDYNSIVQMLKEMRFYPYEKSEDFGVLDIFNKYQTTILIIEIGLIAFALLFMYLFFVNKRLKSYNQKIFELTSELGSIFETSAVGILMLMNGRYVHRANQTMAHMLGYNKVDEMIGMSVVYFHADENRFKEFGDRYFDQLVNREILQLEYQLKRKNGDLFWAQLSGRAIDVNVPADLNKGVIWVIDDISERKSLENELQLEKQKFEEMFLSHSAVMFIVDSKTGHIVDSNPSAQLFYGYSADEMHQLNVADINTDLKREDISKRIEDVRDNKVNQFHFIHTKKDGSKVDVDAFSAPFQVEGKTYLFSIVHDISDELRLKNELLKSEKKFKNVFEHAALGIARVSPEGELIELNERFCEIIGYQQGELTDKAFKEITYPDDLAPDLALVSQTLKGEIDSYTMDKRYVKKDGSIVWCNLTVSLVRDEQSQPDYFISIIVDISERIQNQKEIEQLSVELQQVNEELEKRVIEEVNKRQSQEILFKQMFNSLTSFISIVSRDFKYIAVNQTYMDKFGKSESEIVGQPITTLVTQDQFDIIKPKIKKALTGEVVIHDGYVVLANGSTFYTETSFSPFYNTKGDISAVIVTVKDTTEAVTLKNELTQKEQLMIQQSKLADMGSMIGAIAHQWKQPLNIVNLKMQLFEMDHEDEADVQELASTIYDQVQFMTDTINDFRNFYNPSKEKDYFNVFSTIQTVIKLLSSKIKAQNVDVFLVGDKDIKAYGYKNEFMQVILNLMNNAKDAVLAHKPKNAIVHLLVKDEGGQACVLVKDNGGGIPEELFPDRLFEQFVTSKGADGTGIGLSISKTIIERFMDGSLTAKNIIDGAEFKITLPQKADDIEGDGSDNVMILYVEDDEFTNKTTVKLIGNAYTNIQSFYNGIDGLNFFKEHVNEISIIVTDIDMPEMNGIEMCKEIRKIKPSIPIIAVTAIKQDIFEDIGFNAIFEKPVVTKNLIQSIQKILSL